MFTAASSLPTEKPALYAELARQLEAVLTGEGDAIASAANAAALIYHSLPDVNWAGFYLLKGGELVLGPFQGRPACVRIRPGQGVCGAAATRRAPVRVTDVEAFPGHIACDTASRSELVIPLIAGERLLGVLDLDSPLLGRFDAADEAGCAALARVFLDHLARHPGAAGALCGEG